jgi:hypothetical protein
MTFDAQRISNKRLWTVMDLQPQLCVPKKLASDVLMMRFGADPEEKRGPCGRHQDRHQSLDRWRSLKALDNNPPQ